MVSPAGEAQALAWVSAYEEECGMAAGELLASAAGEAGGLSDEGLMRLGGLCRSFLPFCESVEDIAADDDPAMREDYASGMVEVRPTTPALLVEMGLRDLPVACTEHHLWMVMAPSEEEGGRRHAHGLRLETAKRLPMLLERPALVCDNPGRDDRLVAVLAADDGRGLPLVVPMQPDSAGRLDIGPVMTNLILTVFGRRNFEAYFGSAVSADMVHYVSSAGERALTRLCGKDPFAAFRGVPRDAAVGELACARGGGRPSLQERAEGAGLRGQSGEARACGGMRA